MKKLLYLLLLISCTVQAQDILFVGNSLTYYNNMPEILEYIAEESGVQIQTTSLCSPNYAIIDHLDSGKLQYLLKKQSFDYVIIQQGPSSQAQGKQMLLADGAKVKALCNESKAQLGYYMVWPSLQYYYTFDKVIENHTLAAQKNKALLFPAGVVWKKYNTYKSKTLLYDYDNFHPSKAGSFLAALTIFHTLYPKKNLYQLPHESYSNWVSDKDSFQLMIQLVNDL
ncbi:SGNH/GDSL hydrolase family protein [uncultured Tenacibaculum sp.]|uniref:SGNH/GDSL hydrolase family protein n=1 Tax=uncultured Tenacibaculum sp. TaxID=174713 RepID=UPI00261CCE87|nr:SGNH/GDSL hydrolase family protein [uncultured Tenacibaculum sp.]